ncbi:hypothetical protein C0J52_05183 [Blattella germanica]|nr:hypothetical protein C0J52_05183 [Blattella germanica]
MDMVALEQGLFCDNRDPRRLRLAQNNLLYGLRLADGSIFKYSYVEGPTVTIDTNQCLKSNENEKPQEIPSTSAPQPPPH